MTMMDPVADMLTRIRNAQRSKKIYVEMPSSKVKCAIADVLKDEGYVQDIETSSDGNGLKKLKIHLKYHADSPVIETIDRVSRPGLRVYRAMNELPKVMDGLGVAIISTSKGVMTDKKARSLGIGGEIICTIT